MPDLESGVCPLVVDSFPVTSSPLGLEVGNVWVIDAYSKQMLHHAYIGGGTAVGYAAIDSREFGEAYLSDGGALTGFVLSGETDGVIGYGGTGTLNIPTVPLNPAPTILSGGTAVGFGAGMSGIGNYSWFQKTYSFSEAPGHLSLGR